MNILILGKDPSLFEHGKTIIGDTRKRHIAYANMLQSRFPGSQIRIITYTNKSIPIRSEKVNDSLAIFGTASLHRSTYLMGVIRLLPIVLRHGWRPDVVTVQTPWEEGVIGYLASKFLRAKFILQIHFDLFSAHWKGEARLNPWRSIIARILIKKADAVRVVSEFQKRQLVDKLGKSAGVTHVIPVGVNFQRAEGERSNFRERIDSSLAVKRVVLFVGKFYAPKDLHVWVDVAELVSEQITDVMFVMAGDGPMFSEIKATVGKRGLSNKFIFLGYVRHEALPEIYAAADVFLLTSYYEGFGRVVLEAYLAGVPVVSTKCAGTMDLIEQHVTGILAPVGDRLALADAVISLLENEDLRSIYGLKGNAKVTAEFGFPRLAGKLIDLWGSVCDERP